MKKIIIVWGVLCTAYAAAQTAPKGDYIWIMGLSDQFYAPPNHTVDIDFATTPPTATASYRPVDFFLGGG